MVRKVILIALVVCAIGVALPQNAEARMPPPRLIIQKWMVQIRRDVPHSFGSCVRQPVSHFHVELFEARGGGRYRYLSNFHIGTYHNGRRCFVVWNNYRPPMCLKSCRGTQGGLTYLVRSALVITFTFFGILVPYAVISTLSRLVAVPIYWALP